MIIIGSGLLKKTLRGKSSVSTFSMTSDRVNQIRSSLPSVSIKSIPYTQQHEARRGTSAISETLTSSSMQDIGNCDSDLVFLDGNALKSILLGYPHGALFTCISMHNVLYYPLIVCGFIRRFYLGQATIVGILLSRRKHVFSLWLVLKRSNRASRYTYYTSERSGGYRRVIDTFNKESINYVVLRKYDDISEIKGLGRDLDILVSDDDVGRARTILHDKSGSLRLDVLRISQTFFPPEVANSALKTSLMDHEQCRRPLVKYEYVLLLYHLFFHKDLALTTIHCDIRTKQSTLKSKYLLPLREMEAVLGIDCNFHTLEEYALCLCNNGPASFKKNLSKMSTRNSCLYKYCRSNAHLLGRAETKVETIHDPRIKAIGALFEELLASDSSQVVDKMTLGPQKQLTSIFRLLGRAWNQTSLFTNKLFFVALNTYIPSWADCRRLKVYFSRRIDKVGEASHKNVSDDSGEAPNSSEPIGGSPSESYLKRREINISILYSRFIAQSVFPRLHLSFQHLFQIFFRK